MSGLEKLIRNSFVGTVLSRVAYLFYTRVFAPIKAYILRRKKQIRVIFVITELGTWKSEALYFKMLAHPRFEPVIMVLPTPENGDFCTSVTAIALHIASIPSLDRMAMPVTWRELIDKKILTMYYPEDACNAVVDWTKANGYNTSTYLGRPIVKLSKIYVIIERARA